MTFFEDPRLRQRWNEISHNAETVTENAAAGIWTFSHNYISPCFASISSAVEECLTPCLGDPEERALRAAQRRRRAQYSFDFYDDWEADEHGPEFDSGVGARTGLLALWGGEDWDRLLAGTGTMRAKGGQDSVERHQPKRKRGMNYGTRGPRRIMSSEQDDPTIIPSTAPLGFLSRFPWKVSRTLRYKPSAANLQEHLAAGRSHPEEGAPLLGSSPDEEEGAMFFHEPGRKRSGTTGSGETSDSFRSRGDLFPSDGEGEEDAVPLDDDFTMPPDPATDQSSSGKSRSSKGKRPANFSRLSRTVSRTTMGSSHSKFSFGSRKSSSQDPQTPSLIDPSTVELTLNDPVDLEAEDAEIANKRADAARLAVADAMSISSRRNGQAYEPKQENDDKAESPVTRKDTGIVGHIECAAGDDGRYSDARKLDKGRQCPPTTVSEPPRPLKPPPSKRSNGLTSSPPAPGGHFIPARLPHFS